jgi:thioredoxin-dependent peroxiredoxin
MRFLTRSLAALGMAGLFAGPALPADTPLLKEGDKAPDIAVPATQIDKALPDKKDAKTLKLSELKGKKNVILFFYPAAMTSGCTVESCGFRDVSDQLAKLDTVVVGISTDTLDKQQQFTDKEKLNFPLLADTEKKVTQAFGVPLLKRGEREFAERYSFIIDKTGTIRKVYTKVTPANHPQEVVTFVKENLK